MRNKEAVILETAVALLNEACRLDQSAMQQLAAHRIKCNEQLANHETIQVTSERELGFIGLINGIIERLTGERIAAIYDDREKLLKFAAFKPARITWEEWKAEFIRLCKDKLGWTDDEIGNAWPFDTLKEQYYDQDEVDYLSPNDALYEELSAGD